MLCLARSGKQLDCYQKLREVRFYWEAPDGGNNAPPGYPASEPGYNASPVNPDEPGGPDVPDVPLITKHGILLFLNDSAQINARTSAVWSVSDSTICSIVSSEDGKLCSLLAKKAGTCIVYAVSGTVTDSCCVRVEESGAPADVPSVSGGSLAMEFNLELAPGGSKAIDVPSEYLSLLSMAQWSSSDPSVCTVTADPVAGKFTAVAHKTGECDLTASLGFYSAVCHVTVGRS